MSLGDYNPKTNQEFAPSPPKKPSIKSQPVTAESTIEPPVVLDPIPVNDNVVLSHPIDVKLGPSQIVVESIPPNKIVLLFGVKNRALAKAYSQTGARVRYLSLSEEEDAFISNQGLGISIFRYSPGQTLNPTLSGGAVGLVILGSYQDSHATLEQRAEIARGIAPIVEE